MAQAGQRAGESAEHCGRTPENAGNPVAPEIKKDP